MSEHGDKRFRTVKYGKRGRDWDMQIAVQAPTPEPLCATCGDTGIPLANGCTCRGFDDDCGTDHRPCPDCDPRLASLAPDDTEGER